MLKLSDIAEVKRGYEDPATFLIRHDGEPALLLGVVMQDGWNGLELGKALEPRREAAPCGTAAGLSFTKVTDQAVNIREPSTSSCSSSSSRCGRADRQLRQPRLARRHRGRGRGSADPGGRFRHHDGHGTASSTASRLGALISGARPAGR